MDFGSRLKKIRLERNMIEYELAELLNVSDRTISKWEHGISNPDIIFLRNIVTKLNVSTDYLLGLTDDVEPINKTK